MSNFLNVAVCVFVLSFEFYYYYYYFFNFPHLSVVKSEFCEGVGVGGWLEWMRAVEMNMFYPRGIVDVPLFCVCLQFYVVNAHSLVDCLNSY